jgi:hypothetical protein
MLPLREKETRREGEKRASTNASLSVVPPPPSPTSSIPLSSDRLTKEERSETSVDNSVSAETDFECKIVWRKHLYIDLEMMLASFFFFAMTE